jgi:hypothetical protein
MTTMGPETVSKNVNVSESTMYRFRKQHLEDNPHTRVQTPRRAAAMGDLRNAATAAAVGAAVLFDDPINREGPMPATHIANMDASTLVLKAEGYESNRRAWFLKGSKKKARQEGKQVQVVGTRKKAECQRIKLWLTTLASGQLLTPTFTLVDPGVQKLERIKAHTHTHH